MASAKRGRGHTSKMRDDRYSGKGADFDRYSDDEDDRLEAARSVEGYVIVVYGFEGLCRVFGENKVSGLNEETIEEDIEERFREYGKIKGLHLNLDRRTGFVKGYAFIAYAHKEEAHEAVREQNNTEFLDCKIKVNWAFVKPEAKASKKLRAR